MKKEQRQKMDGITTEERDLRRKRLAVICGSTIREEVDFCAEKYGFDVIYFKFSKSSVSDLLFYILNKTVPRLTEYLMKARRIDGILLITAERIIRRHIPWLSRSGYFFYVTQPQWDVLMDKRRFGEFAAQFGLPGIPEYRIDPASLGLAEGTVFPVVIKPAKGSGSSGIKICHNLEELNKELSGSRGKLPICQKYLEGPYFQFEIWIQDGKAFFPYVKDRVFYPSVDNGPPQPFIDFYPSVNRELVASCLFDKIEKVMDSLNVKNGSCMFQGIIDHGTPYIMDTAFRVSGGLDYKVVRKETDIDLIEAHILYALRKHFGNDFSRLEEPYHQAYATLCVGLKNGTISKIEGVDEIRKKPYVFNLHQYYDIGHRVTTSGLFSQTGIRVFLMDTDREKLKADIKDVLIILRIDDKAGRSLLLDYPEF